MVKAALMNKIALITNQLILNFCMDAVTVTLLYILDAFYCRANLTTFCFRFSVEHETHTNIGISQNISITTTSNTNDDLEQTETKLMSTVN